MEKILKKRISSWDGSTIEEIKFYYFKIFFSKGRVLRVLKTQREIFISETIVEYSEDWGGNLYARSNMFQAYDMIQFSSVTQLWLTLCHPHEPQHARPPCPSPTPGVYPNSCPLSQWCHPTISSSVVLFSFCLQSFPKSGSFPMSQLFALGSQNIGVSALASVLPMNTQDWSPLGWTCWISLQSKGLSRVFSNTTVQKHQIFSAQLGLYSNSHIHTRLLEKP